jgi:hypothetical protein
MFLLLLVSVAIVRCASVPACDIAAGEVQQLERQWLDAYESRDAVAMAGILADGFTITYPDGTVQQRQQVIDYVARQAASSKTGPHFRTEETKARCYARTVILTGRLVTERTVEGEARRSTQRYTDTYVLAGHIWHVAASHLSDIR